MNRYSVLGILAAAVLAAAAVVLGGLNQDEGWYLYAAQLVAEGQMPYKDFFYTQGPLLPLLYAPLVWVWKTYGLLGARVMTLAIGLSGVWIAALLARRLVPDEKKNAATAVTILLLGVNLYHLYYVAIPKTYAIGALFVIVGYYLLACALSGMRGSVVFFFMAGVSLAFAAGARISLGALLAVTGFGLLFSSRRNGLAFLWFGLGGVAGLFAVYGPFIMHEKAFDGLLAAQKYHAARGGFSPVFVVGSLSRLVRWYLPVFIMLGLGLASLKEAFSAVRKARRAASPDARPYAAVVGNPLRPEAPGGSAPNSVARREELDEEALAEEVASDRETSVARFMFWLLLAGFLVVFAVQMLAPFPYEDYQVPVMALLAVAAATVSVRAARGEACEAGIEGSGRRFGTVQLLALGLAFATSFGSPLLEKWTTDGQDRFWTAVKEKPEILQLKDAAARIESLDPGGKELLTQDLYLAIETGRKVPRGLEMGPFAVMRDTEWRRLLSSAPCRVAALSGYSFAIEPPVCNERPKDRQGEFWTIVMSKYNLIETWSRFGQNATPLRIFRKKGSGL